VRTFAALVVLLAALAGAPPASAAGVEYRVEVDAPEAIAAPLRKGLNVVRWQGDPLMTPELLRRLAAQAERDAREVAATEGYFTPEVRVDIDQDAQPWRVTLRVAPGERTRVAAVDIRMIGPGAERPAAMSRLARARKNWALPPGRPFRQEDWDNAKRAAVAEVARRRYAAARVSSSEARIDPAAREARLFLVVDSGPEFSFGEVSVSGTQRYPADIVHNLSPVRPGEVYDYDKLVIYQRRLAESGYFASARTDLDTDPATASAAPLRVTVLEGPSQQLETGISYNTDVGPRLQLRYGDQDMRDSAWRLRSSLALDAKIQELQLDLDEPPRSRARWNSFFARAKRSDVQNEVARTFSVGVAHNFGDDIAPSAAILSWHLEDQTVGAAPTDSRHAVYVGLRRTFRKTDDVVSPRAGYQGSAEVGVGLPGASTQEFARLIGNATYFVPVTRDSDLALRAEGGVVVAEERAGIVTPFLFRTGGDLTVRGYAFESIGVNVDGAVVGGRRLFVASAEYTYWVSENWGIAAFLDAGDAWDPGERPRGALGYGLGARLRTPIGPARVDLAYGELTGDYRLHISIGHVFK